MDMSREYPKSMQQLLAKQYSAESFLGRCTNGDTSAYLKFGIKDGSLPSTGASTPLSEWSAKKDDGDLSLEPSSGSATPPDLEIMLNCNLAPPSSISFGRTLLSLPPGLPLVPPPPGLSLPTSGEQSTIMSGIEASPEFGLMQKPPPTSKGSEGHPHRCAQACRYIKRKGGCKNGSSCPDCHLCFWQRKANKQVEMMQLPEPVVPLSCVDAFSGKIDDSIEQDNACDDIASLGSVNHPDGCNTACKYVNRKGGCRLGKSCLDCHLCHWRRSAPRAMPLKVGLIEKTSQPTQGAQERLEWLIKLQLDSASQQASA